MKNKKVFNLVKIFNGVSKKINKMRSVLLRGLTSQGIKWWKKVFIVLKRLTLKRSVATGKRQTLTIILIAFISILSAYFLFFHSSQALAEWWNTNWHYRKAITISNSGSAQTDTQVKILSNYNISADVTAGKVQSDLDDLRFTTINGQAIKYWIEDSTNTSVDVWGFLPSAPASGATIYMYYGNPNVGAGKSTVGTSTNPGVSCKSILLSGVLTDGAYYIDPTAQESSDKFQAYCNMTTNSGGWVLVMKAHNNDDFYQDNALWENSTLYNETDFNLTSGTKSKYESYTKCPFSDVWFEMGDMIRSRPLQLLLQRHQ